MLKALIYAVQSPPELDEAAKWRAKREAHPADPPPPAPEKNVKTKEIERANA
jgi:hypothetical protein